MGNQLAQNYATGIYNDMAALEWLENNWDDIENWYELAQLMSDDGEDAGAIKSAAYMVDDSRATWEEYGGPVASFFSNDVLDIETISKASAAARSSHVSAVQALVTFGGPNAWIITSDGEGLDILVNWGGDSVKLWANVPAVASYLYGLGAGVDE